VSFSISFASRHPVGTRLYTFAPSRHFRIPTRHYYLQRNLFHHLITLPAHRAESRLLHWKVALFLCLASVHTSANRQIDGVFYRKIYHRHTTGHSRQRPPASLQFLYTGLCIPLTSPRASSPGWCSFLCRLQYKWQVWHWTRTNENLSFGIMPCNVD